MPITWPNGGTNKTCLIDTNILVEFIDNPASINGFVKLFPPKDYAFCISVQSFSEIQKRQPLYEQFVDLFSEIPFFFPKHHNDILKQEVNAAGNIEPVQIVKHVFSPNGPNSRYDFKLNITSFFDSPASKPTLEGWQQDRVDTWKSWMFEITKDYYQHKFAPAPNPEDGARYAKNQIMVELIKHYPEFLVTFKSPPFYETVPSLTMRQLSKYYRIYNAGWMQKRMKARPAPLGEVTDVHMSAIAPYMDAVIVEKFQAEIYRRIQKHVDGVRLDIKTVRDMRKAA